MWQLKWFDETVLYNYSKQQLNVNDKSHVWNGEYEIPNVDDGMLK